MLDELCKRGIGKSSERSDRLRNVGVVSIGNRHYWPNHEALLRYEMQTQKNCLNKIASQQVLESIEVIRVKEQELKSVKEEELRKVEEE